MSDQAANLEILIQIREELAGLRKTQQGLRDTKKEAEGLGSIVRQGLGIGTGMALATGAIAMLKNTLIGTAAEAFRFSEEIRDQSQALEMSARAYQVLRYEMAKGGVDAARLTMAMSSQIQTMGEARDIGSAAATSYRMLGLDLAKLEQMPTEQRLLAVVRATLEAKDKTQAYSAAAQILGARGLPQLLAALREAAYGFDGIATAAERSGVILDQDTAESLDKAKKRWENFKLWSTVQGAGLLNALVSPMDNSVGAILARDRARAAAAANQPAQRTQQAPLPLIQTVQWRQQELAIMRAQNEEAAIQASSWDTEEGKRLKLVRVIQAQVQAQETLLKLLNDTPLTASENQADRTRAIVEAEGRLALLRQGRLNAQLGDKPRTIQSLEDYRAINNPDRAGYMTASQGALTGVRDFMVSLGSTGEQVASILNSTLGQTMSSLSADIWEAMKGTQGWGEAFKNVGNIAGRMLTQMIIQMTLVKSIQTALGWLGIVSGAGAGGVSAAPAAGASAFPTLSGLADTSAFIGSGAGAGGGTFVTRGPAQLTVGDNPGGVELVNVIPISGKGRSWSSGSLTHFAGGGSLLAGAGLAGGASAVAAAPVHFAFNFSLGVAATVRAEIMTMVPELRAMAVDAVAEAHGRNQLKLSS